MSQNKQQSFVFIDGNDDVKQQEGIVGQEDEQQQQQEIIKRMLQMQKQYERLRKKYQHVKKKVKNNIKNINKDDKVNDKKYNKEQNKSINNDDNENDNIRPSLPVTTPQHNNNPKSSPQSNTNPTIHNNNNLPPLKQTNNQKLNTSPITIKPTFKNNYQTQQQSLQQQSFVFDQHNSRSSVIVDNQFYSEQIDDNNCSNNSIRDIDRDSNRDSNRDRLLSQQSIVSGQGYNKRQQQKKRMLKIGGNQITGRGGFNNLNINNNNNTFIYEQRSFQTQQCVKQSSSGQQSFVYDQQVTNVEFNIASVINKNGNKIELDKKQQEQHVNKLITTNQQKQILKNKKLDKDKDSFCYQPSLNNDSHMQSFQQYEDNNDSSSCIQHKEYEDSIKINNFNEYNHNNNKTQLNKPFMDEKHLQNHNQHNNNQYNNNNKHKQSIISNSIDYNSFQFKNDDSLPLYNRQDKGTKYYRHHYYKQNNKVQDNNSQKYQDSFTYKSSTGQQSFQYQPSERSMLAAAIRLKQPFKQHQDNHQKQHSLQRHQIIDQHHHQQPSKSFSFQQSIILSNKHQQQQSNYIDSFVYDKNGDDNHQSGFDVRGKQQIVRQVKESKEESGYRQLVMERQIVQEQCVEKKKSIHQSISQPSKIAKIPQNLKPKPRQLQISSDASYQPSIQSNNNDHNYQYNIRKFSFQLPSNIHDPFQIKDYIEPIIINDGSEKITQQQQYNNKNKPKHKTTTKKPSHPLTNNNNLQRINQAYDDEYQSQQQQQYFLKKLINKLNIHKTISLKEIKKLIKQIKQLAEQNMQLIEIFQTGTYQLDYIDKGSHIDWKTSYIEKVNSWSSRILITQLSMQSGLNYQYYYDFFTNIQLPNLQQITIQIKHSVYKQQNQRFVRSLPDEKYSIGFLKYNGLCKRLRTLSLRGQTMTLQIAKNLVDLDFPTLKSLYLGFQAHLTDEIVEILTCNKFQNMPKTIIYIASWDGELDTRFRWFFDKVKFIPLEQGQEDISLEELKYRAKKIKIQNHNQWRQGLNQGLKEYFQEKNVSEQI